MLISEANESEVRVESRHNSNSAGTWIGSRWRRHLLLLQSLAHTQSPDSRQRLPLGSHPQQQRMADSDFMLLVGRDFALTVSDAMEQVNHVPDPDIRLGLESSIDGMNQKFQQLMDKATGRVPVDHSPASHASDRVAQLEQRLAVANAKISGLANGLRSLEKQHQNLLLYQETKKADPGLKQSRKEFLKQLKKPLP